MSLCKNVKHCRKITFLNERTANYNFDLNRLLALFYIHFKSQLGSFSKLDSYENRNYDFSQEIRFFLYLT